MFGAVGVIAFWAGIWEGIAGMPYLENPWISLVVGLTMLSFSGLIFQQFDPLEMIAKRVSDILYKVQIHPQKHEFLIKYHDKIKKKHVLLKAKELKGIDNGFLIFIHGKEEVFVPIHRVTEILHNSKTFWKL